jgi:hypothetical protein
MKGGRSAKEVLRTSDRKANSAKGLILQSLVQMS